MGAIAEQDWQLAVSLLRRKRPTATTVRCPGSEPTLDEARKAVEIARAVRSFARHFLAGL